MFYRMLAEMLMSWEPLSLLLPYSTSTSRFNAGRETNAGGAM